LGSESAEEVYTPPALLSQRGGQRSTRTVTLTVRVSPTARFSTRQSNVVAVKVHPSPPTYAVPGCAALAPTVAQGSGTGPWFLIVCVTVTVCPIRADGTVEVMARSVTLGHTSILTLALALGCVELAASRIVTCPPEPTGAPGLPCSVSKALNFLSPLICKVPKSQVTVTPERLQGEPTPTMSTLPVICERSAITCTPVAVPFPQVITPIGKLKPASWPTTVDRPLPYSRRNG